MSEAELWSRGERGMDARGWVLRSGIALAVLPGAILYPLVLAGRVDPRFASHVMALLVFSGFLALVSAPFLPRRERCSRAEQLADLLYVWTIASTCAQLGWELPFVLLSPWLDGATAGDRWAWLWWAYGIADSRYLIADSFVVCMEGVTSIAGAPLEIYTLLLFRRGRIKSAAALSLLVNGTQFYGAALYFGIELHAGLVHINTGHPVDLWVKFVGLNLLWLVLPAVAMVCALRVLSSGASDAELGRRLGAQFAPGEPAPLPVR